MNLLGTYRILHLSDVMTLTEGNKSWPCISCCFMLVHLMYLINLHKSFPADQNFLYEMFVTLFYLVLLKPV